MGEEVGGVPEAAPLKREQGDDPSAEAAELSIGLYLASQRRLRGISLEELAATTKIPRRSLERLEAGAFDGSADGFSRGFVRTVAEALGLDPTEAVMRLMSEPSGDEAGGAAGRLGRHLPLAGIALGAGAALALVLIWRLLSAWLAPAPGEPSAEVVVREDPVRALAREASREPSGVEAGEPAPASPPPRPGGSAP